MRHVKLVVLAAAGLILMPAACFAAEASRDSLDLYGTWEWDSSYRAQGAHQTPQTSGYGMELTIGPGNTYRLVEQDSASAYLRSAGRLEVHPTTSAACKEGRGFARLVLENWEPRYDGYMAAISGHDTLCLYPGGPCQGVPDASVQRYVRAGTARTAAGKPMLSVRPRAERPPRLVSAGYGLYDIGAPDSLDRLNRLMNPFRKVPDRLYSEKVRGAYHYRHDQTPAAVIGDFDGNGVYDVVVYARNGSEAAVLGVLDWNRVGNVVVIRKDSLAEGSAPGATLEVVPKGSRVEGAGVLARDAVRAVKPDGSSELFVWNGEAFVAAAKQ